MHPDQIVDLRREFTTLRNKLHPVHDFEKQRSMTVLVGRLEEMLKRLDDEELHATFPALVAYHVRLHGRLRFARRAVCVRIIQ